MAVLLIASQVVFKCRECGSGRTLQCEGGHVIGDVLSQVEKGNDNAEPRHALSNAWQYLLKLGQ